MRKWLLALAVLSAPAAAQEDRVRDALALRERWQWLTRDVAFPAQWDSDGRHFHYRKTVAGGFAFVEVDAATQAKRAPFDAAALARGLSAVLGRTVDPLRLPFEQFAFADDRRAIEAEVDYAPVRCVLATMACEKVADRHRPRGFGVVRDLSVPALNDPQRSPDGTLEALVVDDNLVVRAAGGGAEKWRSQDGTAGDFYDPETIAWAPDGRHVAAFRVRPGYRRIVTRVVSSPPGEVQPRVVQQLYPKPGDAVDQERPVIFDTATGRGATVDDVLFPNPYYLSDLAWRADGRSLSFSYLRRGFGQARVIAVDAATARAHVAVGEDAKTFVFNDKRWAHDVDNKGREILWASERDGWRHLYLIDGTTGRVKRQITRGQWIVRDIARVDDAARRIWFSASGMDAGRDPYLKAWFRVDFDGRNLVRLTPDDGDTHDAAFAPDDARFVDVHSRVDKPPVAELRDGANGAMVATLERGDASALTAAGFRPPEPFVAKGRDGVTDIWGVVVRPRDFDPAKRYPVIENIYAGPHDSFVPKAFWPFGAFSGGDKAIGMQQLADLGFVVVMIDGMGTANRSKAFHDVAWKNMDDMGFPDRIAWMKTLAAKDPSLDLSRVGLYGGSAGGQNTLSGLLFHPDFYKAGVAFAGCFDNRMDKIDWNEQWLGWPVDRSYLDASGVVNAAKLKGKLLLVVGEQDSNVDPASTMQVVDALIRADKDFELLVIPNGEHAAGRSNGPVAYGQRREYDFFLRTLRGEGLTEWNAR